MAEEIKTFLDIQDAIIARGKLENTTAVRTDLKEYINTCYQRLASREHYSWSGADGWLRLRGKYTTGSVTATNLADTLTGASTVWTENLHFGWKIHVAGVNTPYKIIRVTSNTALTMDAFFTGDTAATLGYTMYKDEYGLFPDLQDIRKFRIPGLSTQLQPIPCGPHEMDEKRDRNPFREGLPRYYTIHGVNHYHEKTMADFNIDHDYWEDDPDTQPRNKNLLLWPGIYTSDRIAYVRFTRFCQPMDADADEPLIPKEYRSILVWGGLRDYAIRNRDITLKREWEGYYKEDEKAARSDIESVDDEMILKVDQRGHSWNYGEDQRIEDNLE